MWIWIQGWSELLINWLSGAETSFIVDIKTATLSELYMHDAAQFRMWKACLSTQIILSFLVIFVCFMLFSTRFVDKSKEKKTKMELLSIIFRSKRLSIARKIKFKMVISWLQFE